MRNFHLRLWYSREKKNIEHHTSESYCPSNEFYFLVVKHNPHTQNQVKRQKKMFLFRDVLVFCVLFFFLLFVSCKIHHINMENVKSRVTKQCLIAENIILNRNILNVKQFGAASSSHCRLYWRKQRRWHIFFFL